MLSPNSKHFCIAAMSVFGASTLLVAQSNQLESEEVYELSPFTVSEDEQIGYQATSTLAGTRIKTPLRDIGSAVSVITAELFEDTGAVDAETILSYATNMEISGAFGNFADGLGTNHNGRAEQDLQRENPQISQRVRGLASASLTRNFFLTDIPFDSYNTDRVDISRGANSLLFGIGAPGGIINNTVHKASVDGDDFTEISVRIGERNSHRETLDYHNILSQGRLAFRLSALHDDTIYQQRPAFEIDKRIHGAFEAVLMENEGSDSLGRTLLRGDFEVGSMHGYPVNIFPPSDQFSTWFDMPNVLGPDGQPVPGVILPSYHPDNPANITPGRLNRTTYNFSTGESVPQTSWRPMQVFDNRNPIRRAHIPNIVENPTFLQAAVVYYPTVISGPSIHSGWYPDIEAITSDTPGSSGLAVYPLATQSLYSGNRNEQLLPNFVTPVILNPQVWDNENRMIQGTTQTREISFDTHNLTLEQTFLGGDAGIELAYDKQNYRQEVDLPFSFNESGGDTANSDVVIDIGQFIGTGEPNPNLGRPMMKQRPLPKARFRETSRESTRFTGFYEFDFAETSDSLGWLGRHTFTGFLNSQKNDTLDWQRVGTWITEDGDLRDPKYVGNPSGGYFRQVASFVYLGPSVFDAGITSPDQLQLDGDIRVNLPSHGDTFSTLLWNKDTDSFEEAQFYVEEFLQSGARRRFEVDTKVLSWQGRFLNDHIVGLYGWRDDEMDTTENITPGNPQGISRLIGSSQKMNPDYLRLQDSPTSSDSGETSTWSVVAHAPHNWLGDSPFSISAHISESENFQVLPTGRNVRGEIIGNPAGETEEAGFTVGYKGLLFARVNWFETRSARTRIPLATATEFFSWNQNWLSGWGRAQYVENLSIRDALVMAGGNGNEFSSYDQVYNEIIGFLPPDVQAIRNMRIDNEGIVTSDPNPGQTATRDFVSEGLEIEIVANLTSNWRAFLNVAQQESVQSNTAQAIADVTREHYSRIQSSPLADLLGDPVSDDIVTIQERYQALVIGPLSAILSRDGTPALEQREWRINAVTNYQFDEGALKGLGIGTGIRHQSKNAVGFENKIVEGEAVPDITKPFFGPAQLNGDIWISYQRPIWDDRMDWKIQLNVRNAYGDDSPIPVVINPDGNLAVIRNSIPQEIFLTNTFRF